MINSSYHPLGCIHVALTNAWCRDSHELIGRFYKVSTSLGFTELDQLIRSKYFHPAPGFLPGLFSGGGGGQNLFLCKFLLLC